MAEIMAQNTTYTWGGEGFDPADDMTGALVGFKNTYADYDLSETGIIEPYGADYKVVINGVTLKANKSGVVYDSIPAGSSHIGHTLRVVIAAMGGDTAVGGAITRSGGSDDPTQYSDNVNVMAVGPRDSFAMQIMNAILKHADHPEAFDDAKWLYYARAAYKGAQAMMIAAADARHGQALNPSQEAVTVNSDELQDNTEKLLYNMGQYMKTGVALKGEVVAAGGTATPIQTKVTEMPDVAVKNPLDANDDPIPLGTTAVITELPAVEVKNPLDANDDPIPLTVDNAATT